MIEPADRVTGPITVELLLQQVALEEQVRRAALLSPSPVPLIAELVMREGEGGVRDRVRHLLEHAGSMLCDGVARRVVARVVRGARGAAEDRGLLRGLDVLGAGEQATRRNAVLDEGEVVDCGRRTRSARSADPARRSSPGRRTRRHPNRSGPSVPNASPSPSYTKRTGFGEPTMSKLRFAAMSLHLPSSSAGRRSSRSRCRPSSSPLQNAKRMRLVGSIPSRPSAARSRGSRRVPDPLSLMPGPSVTLSRCAPDEHGAVARPPRVGEHVERLDRRRGSRAATRISGPAVAGQRPHR